MPANPLLTNLPKRVGWYETRRVGLGGEFFDAVAAALTLIEARPELGTALSTDGQTRRLVVPRFPWQVVYRLKSTNIIFSRQKK